MKDYTIVYRDMGSTKNDVFFDFATSDNITEYVMNDRRYDNGVLFVFDSKLKPSEDYKEPNIKFPVFAKADLFKDDTLVVLFSDLTTGMVVVGDNIHNIGYMESTWFPVNNPKYWKILPNDTTIPLKIKQ